MVKKLSCVSCGSLKRFPHTFTSGADYTHHIQMSPPSFESLYWVNILKLNKLGSIFLRFFTIF